MSRTTSKLPPRIVEQRGIFGGVDVLTLYGEGGHTRANVLHCESKERVRDMVSLARRFEQASAVGTDPTAIDVVRCPNCGRSGHIETDFGMRLLRGRRRPQSWCRKCRTAGALQAKAAAATERRHPNELRGDDAR
jgi:hypothetical protein